MLDDVIRASDLLKHERQKLTSPNLTLLLVHDLLLSKGKIQAGDGPIKQAVLRQVNLSASIVLAYSDAPSFCVLRHKTRLQSELTKIKIKRGVKSDSELAQGGDPRAGAFTPIQRCVISIHTNLLK